MDHFYAQSSHDSFSRWTHHIFYVVCGDSQVLAMCDIITHFRLAVFFFFISSITSNALTYAFSPSLQEIEKNTIFYFTGCVVMVF